MNQELEQYLRFFIDHRQKDWLEWLALAEFVVNDKVHITTKMSSFMANYGRELRMGGDIRKKGKVKKATEFVKRMKKVHEEAGVALKKAQEDIKRQADCYESRLKGLSQETTLVLSNTRELDRVSSTE